MVTSVAHFFSHVAEVLTDLSMSIDRSFVHMMVRVVFLYALSVHLVFQMEGFKSFSFLFHYEN